MLRAFVQVREDGMPFNVNAYTAYDGFREGEFSFPARLA